MPLRQNVTQTVAKKTWNKLLKVNKLQLSPLKLM